MRLGTNICTNYFPSRIKLFMYLRLVGGCRILLLKAPLRFYNFDLSAVILRLFVQWNLSIADMLYSGHQDLADTFCSDWENHGQTLIKNPLYSGQFTADTRYNGHFFPRLWRKINLSIADSSEICLKQ